MRVMMVDGFIETFLAAPIAVRLMVALGVLSSLANLAGWSSCAFQAFLRSRPRRRRKDGRFAARPLRLARKDATRPHGSTDEVDGDG